MIDTDRPYRGGQHRASFTATKLLHANRHLHRVLVYDANGRNILAGAYREHGWGTLRVYHNGERIPSRFERILSTLREKVFKFRRRLMWRMRGVGNGPI